MMLTDIHFHCSVPLVLYEHIYMFTADKKLKHLKNVLSALRTKIFSDPWVEHVWKTGTQKQKGKSVLKTS